MNTARKEARKMLTEMGSVDEYRRIMDRVKLTPLEREVCDRKYLQGQNLAFIGDMLGFSKIGQSGFITAPCARSSTLYNHFKHPFRTQRRGCFVLSF